jgi:ABC-type glycerol-3-phosphate transport system permease component
MKPGRKPGLKPGMQRATSHTLLTGGALAMLYPLLWMISSSFKPTHEIFTNPGLWPHHPTLANYRTGWTALGTNFGWFYANSFLISLAAVAGNTLSCSMAAYAFARLRFRLKRLWFATMLTSIMLPIHVLIIPQYTLFHALGWIGTFLPLIIPKFLATDGFFIFLMTQFIRGLPTELDDAARIDGCGPIQTYHRITLPLMTPALVTTAIFTFIWTWDDFLSQLVYLDNTNHYTVPIALRAFLDTSNDTTWPAMLAMATLALIPVLTFFLIFQRRITDGISTTGLGG